MPQCSQSTPGHQENRTLWNKRPDEGPSPKPQPQYQPPAAAPAQTPAAVPQRVDPAPSRSVATIGSSMNIKGEIRSNEELVVDGDVEGALESQSVLTIGAKGKVRAHIKAREVHIFGSVRGNVDVTGKIAIREQGSLVGDIKAAGISIDDGAYFKGNIDIVRPEPKVTTGGKQSKPEVHVEAKAG
jgi:cytoskeletal protein CcmA (bactofilin family)